MYTTKQLWLNRDKKAKEKWEQLMMKSGLNTQEEVEYTVGIYHGDTLAAAGSYAHNVIKCVAVCKEYQAENLLTKIIVHLMEKLQSEGVHHYFVYTKPENSKYFSSLGFKKVIENEKVTFLEFGVPDFQSYLELLKKHKVDGNNAAIVMNANPFTKGHLYLITQALSQGDHVYVFVLSEDRSNFSSEDRLAMVKQGTAHLDNITILPTKDYMVSSATFPSYFLKENANEDVARVQANLDAQLFMKKIAPALNIRYRFVGEEPYSKVTNVYNQMMAETFQEGLKLIVVPRKETMDDVISATKVRELINANQEEKLKEYVPKTTYKYIQQLNK